MVETRRRREYHAVWGNECISANHGLGYLVKRLHYKRHRLRNKSRISQTHPLRLTRTRFRQVLCNLCDVVEVLAGTGYW